MDIPVYKNHPVVTWGKRLILFLAIIPTASFSSSTDQKNNNPDKLKKQFQLRFEQADRNRDGFLTNEEFSTLSNKKYLKNIRHFLSQVNPANGIKNLDSDQLFNLLDLDNNDQITRAEMSQKALYSAQNEVRKKRIFEFFDVDNDKVISEHEFHRGAQRHAPNKMWTDN